MSKRRVTPVLLQACSQSDSKPAPSSVSYASDSLSYTKPQDNKDMLKKPRVLQSATIVSVPVARFNTAANEIKQGQNLSNGCVNEFKLRKKRRLRKPFWKYYAFIPMRTTRVRRYIRKERVGGEEDIAEDQLHHSVTDSTDEEYSDDSTVDDTEERINFANYSDEKKTMIRDLLEDLDDDTLIAHDDFTIKFEIFPVGKEKPNNRMLEYCLGLTEENMKTLYDSTSGWSWSITEKRKELENKDARLLIAFAKPNQGELCPIGFSHFRFLREGDAAVLYVYELQLEKQRYRRKGVGTHIMNILESIARNWEMDWIMLTVFQSNRPAMAFYQKLGYSIDETSPLISKKNKSSKGHLILSKKLF